VQASPNAPTIRAKNLTGTLSVGRNGSDCDLASGPGSGAEIDAEWAGALLNDGWLAQSWDRDVKVVFPNPIRTPSSGLASTVDVPELSTSAKARPIIATRQQAEWKLAITLFARGRFTHALASPG
jgi:hypothetical protein